MYISIDRHTKGAKFGNLVTVVEQHHLDIVSPLCVAMDIIVQILGHCAQLGMSGYPFFYQILISLSHNGLGR